MSRTIRNCNVAVLGGAGFLGSACTDHLIDDRNCQVIVIDNFVAGRREFIHKQATFIHHDITGSEDYLREVFKHHDIRYVLNFVAYPYVPDSFARPLRVFDVNAMGALKAMNAAQEAGVEGILQVSSAEIYGESTTTSDGIVYARKIGVDDEVKPHSTYGAAKGAIDSLVQCRWREAKTPCIALRQFNCVGPRDEMHPYIVPEIVKQLVADSNCKMTTRGIEQADVGVVRLGNNTFRDFLYSGDAVRMAVELLEKGEFGEVYNSGSEEGIKMYPLAKLIGDIMGFKNVEVVPDPARIRPWDIEHLQADNSKLYSVIDYRPRVKLREALERTINYFRSTGWRLP